MLNGIKVVKYPVCGNELLIKFERTIVCEKAVI